MALLTTVNERVMEAVLVVVRGVKNSVCLCRLILCRQKQATAAISCGVKRKL